MRTKKPTDRGFVGIGGGRRDKLLRPVKVDDGTWFYVYPRKLDFVREVRGPAGELIKTEVFSVPVTKIRAALAAALAAENR